MTMRIILILLVCISSNTAFAQYKLQGIIQEEDQKNLPFANVILLSETETFIKGEVSESNGVFVFSNVSAGNYILTISAIGFQEYRQIIQLTNHLNLGIISIAQSFVALEEVTVTAQKVAYVRKADRTIVNVASLPTAAGSNALELLEKSPSVQINRVNGNVSLLGRNDVVVFMNSKRIRLGGNDLLQYLSSIPSANIESLELINNPPASYDADGTGGVINIITQNYEADGLNGNGSVFAGYRQRVKYGGTATINYKSGKLNTYAMGSTSQNYTFQNSDILSAIQFDDGLINTDQKSIRPAYLGNHNGKIGFAYAFNDNTSVDVFASFARRRWELSAETTSEYRSDIFPAYNDFLTGDETNTTNQYHISTHLQQKLKNGHTLSADYDYLNFNILNPTSYQLQSFDANNELHSQVSFNSDKETPFDFHVTKLDYKGDINKNINFETGFKLTLSTVENNTAFIDGNGTVASDNLFTGSTNLSEQIYAAYFSMNGSFGGKFTLIGGLRYEYSGLALNANRDRISRQISRLFPSLSIARNFSETSSLTLAYRERISRPGFQNLVPAFFFLNPFTVLTGNIQALPNINRTVEATLNHKFFFISLSYSNDNNPIVGYAQLNQEEHLLLLISDNIEDRKQLGLTIEFPLKFTSFWNSRYNIDSYWRRDEMLFTDATIIESHPFFNIDVSQTFQLPKDWSLELSGRWNSLVYWGTIYRPQRASLNFGVQKKFKKASFGLSWTDIFNTGSYFSMINELPEQGIIYNWNYDLEGSIFRFSYTYNFGSQQVKNARNSGASDVLKRVNE